MVVAVDQSRRDVFSGSIDDDGVRRHVEITADHGDLYPANEQVGLTALHTLFVREHNRLADLIAERHPEMSGEEVYQKARQLVALTGTRMG